MPSSFDGRARRGDTFGGRARGWRYPRQPGERRGAEASLRSRRSGRGVTAAKRLSPASDYLTFGARVTSSCVLRQAPRAPNASDGCRLVAARGIQPLASGCGNAALDRAPGQSLEEEDG
jgi:hypothetical protein